MYDPTFNHAHQDVTLRILKACRIATRKEGERSYGIGAEVTFENADMPQIYKLVREQYATPYLNAHLEWSTVLCGALLVTTNRPARNCVSRRGV